MKPFFWQENYESLPPPKQEEVDGWVGTVMFIAAQLGLPPEEWTAMVQAAHDDPDDYSFLQKVEVFTDTDKLDESGNPREVAAKLGGPQKDLASIPKVGEEKPEGSLSLSMLNFPRRS